MTKITGGRMSYLRYLCLFTYSGVQHILLCFCFVCLRLVYPMLPVSVDCLILIVPSILSDVYYEYREDEGHQNELKKDKNQHNKKRKQIKTKVIRMN